MSNGLSIIEKLKEAEIRSELELDFLIALGGVEIVSSGYTHPNVEKVFKKSSATNFRTGA